MPGQVSASYISQCAFHIIILIFHYLGLQKVNVHWLPGGRNVQVVIFSLGMTFLLHLWDLKFVFYFKLIKVKLTLFQKKQRHKHAIRGWYDAAQMSTDVNSQYFALGEICGSPDLKWNTSAQVTSCWDNITLSCLWHFQIFVFVAMGLF